MADENTNKKKSKAGLRLKSASSIQKKSTRNWTFLGIGLAVGVVILGSLAGGGAEQSSSSTPKDVFIETTPEGLDKRSWELQSQADILEMKKILKQLTEQNNSLSAKLEDQNQKLIHNEDLLHDYRSRIEKKVEEVERLSGKLEQKLEAEPKLSVRMPQVQGPDGRVSGVRAPAPQIPQGGNADSQLLMPPPPPLPRNAQLRAEAKQGDSAVPGSAGYVDTVSPQPQVNNSLVLSFDAADDSNDMSGGDPVEAQINYRKNPKAGFLAPGFAEVTLLHGIDAGSSDFSKSNPEPLLMRIQNNAMLPGNARYKLHGCFVSASVFGDLSSERVKGRLTSLNCIDNNDRLVLSAPIKGYLVDSDGFTGLRGKLDHRNGALLAKTLLASTAAGFGNLFSAAQSYSSGAIMGEDTESINYGQALAAGGFQGVSEAANKLADYYLQQASSIFPIISVPAGRKATIVIEKGASLHWEDHESLYVKDVTPTGTKK